MHVILSSIIVSFSLLPFDTNVIHLTTVKFHLVKVVTILIVIVDTGN